MADDELSDVHGRQRIPAFQGKNHLVGIGIETGLSESADRENDALRGGGVAAADKHFAVVLEGRDCVEVGTSRNVGCTSRPERWVHARLSALMTKKESRTTTREERRPAILDRECMIVIDRYGDIPMMMRT